MRNPHTQYCVQNQAHWLHRGGADTHILEGFYVLLLVPLAFLWF